MRNRFHTHQGLTLVELLVAISVLAIVAVLGWRGLDSITRSRLTLTSDLEQTRELQLTFAQLQSDCLHLASSTILLDRPSILIQGAQLNMARTVFTEGQPSRLQVVSYQVKDSILTRRESAATGDLNELDQLWQATINNTDNAPTVTLQSGVNNFTMRLWMSGGNDWQVPAPAAANTTATTTLPLAPTGLEVALQLQGRNTRLLKIFLLGAR